VGDLVREGRYQQVLGGMNRALGQGMTNLMRLLATLLLLLSSCDGSNSGDEAPGPADAFVGVWQGSGTTQTYSGSGGEYNWATNGKVTISRLDSAAVVVDASQLDPKICSLTYDIDAEGVGHLRPNQECSGSSYRFDNGTLTLKGEVLTMGEGGTVCCTLTEPTDLSIDVTLTRAP
jgi:hypothetical protein